ncbi:methyltransferase domain-containing protein [Leeuwenhoekiella sp. A16]|uniref:methyltransferase domain-containing protein n=1 Tax=unclassified Leeuwenhoekiella TaxID=2615029 RepID=UPI003A8038AD|tara:strand:- start:513 stop:1214 length:702 start_codon:yes stop_codon:yes gene_type:complete
MKQRILIPELMDDPSLDLKTLSLALQDVSQVNRLLGGNQVTINGLDYFFKKYQQPSYTIVDLGCGDGEMLRAVAKFGRKKNLSLRLIGMDINEKSLALAKEKSVKYPEITFLQQDILKLDSDSFSCDIVISTLTMHHFTNEEIVIFLKCFLNLSTLGFVINDLHRSSIAYNLFKLYSSFFMRTDLAKHDGLISIQRAFKKEELTSLVKELNVKTNIIKWQWAFRYLWIADKKA